MNAKCSTFAQAVLVPELALRLVSEDQSITLEAAHQYMEESSGFGAQMYEDEDVNTSRKVELPSMV